MASIKPMYAVNFYFHSSNVAIVAIECWRSEFEPVRSISGPVVADAASCCMS